MEEAWAPKKRSVQNKRNRRTIASMPSLLSNSQPCEPHHFPISRGRTATDGLLEMVPLTHDEHELAQQNDPWTLTLLESLHPDLQETLYQRYTGTDRYLGPPELVAVVRERVERKIAERRRLLGV